MDLMSENEVRGVAGAGVQSLMDAGQFPQPIERGPGGARRWSRAAVETWQAQWAAATRRPKTRERKERGRRTRPAQ